MTTEEKAVMADMYYFLRDALAEMLKSILPRDSAKPSEGNKQKPGESEPQKTPETETVKPTAPDSSSVSPVQNCF